MPLQAHRHILGISIMFLWQTANHSVRGVISTTYTEQSKKPVPRLSLKDTLICNKKHTMIFWDTTYRVVTSVFFISICQY